MSNKTVSMVKAKPERLNIGKAKHICKTQPSRKEQLVRKIESTDKTQHTDKEKPMHEINLIHKKKHTYKMQPMYKTQPTYKRVVISPNSAGGRSIKTAPTTINQNRKLKSFFGFQSQPDTLKLISLKALLPLGYSHSNRFYLT